MSSKLKPHFTGMTNLWELIGQSQSVCKNYQRIHSFFAMTFLRNTEEVLVYIVVFIVKYEYQHFHRSSSPVSPASSISWSNFRF